MTTPTKPKPRVTYKYVTETLKVHRQRIASENRIIKAMLEASLEAGLSHIDAVNIAIGVYKELDVLARDEKGNLLSRTALKDIRIYCRAILSSGTSFQAFEIANRAVNAWKLAAQRMIELHNEWDRESVTQRLKMRRERQERAQRLAAERRNTPLLVETDEPGTDTDDTDTDDTDTDNNIEGSQVVETMYDDFDELRRLSFEVEGLNADVEDELDNYYSRRSD